METFIACMTAANKDDVSFGSHWSPVKGSLNVRLSAERSFGNLRGEPANFVVIYGIYHTG
jgi:hypothetical protein